MAMPLVCGRKRARKQETKAEQALRIASSLQRAVEVKYIDYISGGGVVDWDGKLLVINDVAQGLTDTERNGDRIHLRRLTIRGFVELNGSANPLLQMMIIWDKQDTLVAPSNVLSVTGNSIAPIANLLWDRRYEFKVLAQRKLAVDTYHPLVPFEFSLKLDKNTQFQAGSTTIQTGALKFLFISSINSVSVQPLIWYHARTEFTDL